MDRFVAAIEAVLKPVTSTATPASSVAGGSPASSRAEQEDVSARSALEQGDADGELQGREQFWDVSEDAQE